MSQDANDFLSGGAPAAKFTNIGDICKGVILSNEVKQQTDLEGKPKFYDDGNPMTQLVVTLQTDERDDSISNDDGQRRLFVKGQMKAAVGQAVRQSGAKFDNGGTLAVQFVSETPSEKRGYSPTKQYRAQYVAPDMSAAANDLLGTTEPAPVATAAPAAPAVTAGDLI